MPDGGDAHLHWRPMSRPQEAFIACPVFEIFFGGSRGSLKTGSALGDWMNHSETYGKHAVGLMVRRTREELKETYEVARQMMSPMGYKFSGSQHVAKGPTGSMLTFAYLDKDEDAQRYQGWNLTRVYVEEIGNFPRPDPIYKLFATLRSVQGVPVGFRAKGYPGGAGHQWVKARYITPAPSGWKILASEYKDPFTGEVDTKHRIFIPGKITDHNLLDRGYITQLQMAGSDALVRAWLLGDWDVVEGAFFDKWRPELIIEPIPIPPEWPRFMSGDWGYAAPFSFGWWAIAQDDTPCSTGVIPRGALVRYREWYGVKYGTDGAVIPDVGIRLDADEVGPELLERSAGEKLDIGVLDPAAWQSQSGPSVAERLMQKGPLWRQADNRRVGIQGAVGGWDMMRSRIRGNDDGRPMLYFFDTCLDSIRTIPTLQHDPDRAEDLDTESEDHAADDVRYACMSRPYVRPSVSTPKPVFPYTGVGGGERIVGNIPIRELIDRRMRRMEAGDG